MKRKIYISALLLLGLHSCTPKYRMTYFKDLSDSTYTTIKLDNKTEQRIKVDDVVSIKVSTLNAESNTLFNEGVLASASTKSGITSSSLSEGYKVDKNGDINFPVLGKIHIADKTLEEARDLVAQKISGQVKDPIVNVRLLNAQVTIVGEVGMPGVVNISERKTSLLEAIGKAGDIKATGRKDNVLLIRENGTQREMVRLNLNSINTITSPYYYLQQNDLIVVEPTKRQERMAQGQPDALALTTLSLTSVSTLLNVYSIILNLRKN
jgi:polysaccharide export outer membrane protein